MSFLTQSRLAADQTIVLRVAACAAKEGISDPQFWAQQRMWELSAQPGWVAAYASAAASHKDEGSIPPPGENEAAITDSMILSAVQALTSESPAE